MGKGADQRLAFQVYSHCEKMQNKMCFLSIPLAKAKENVANFRDLALA